MRTLFLLLLPLFACLADEPLLRIAVPEHPAYSKNNQNGYWRQLLTALQDAGWNGVKIVPFPLLRGIEGYKQKTYHCFVDGDESIAKIFGVNPETKVFSQPFQMITSRVYTLSQPICQTSELAGKSVVYVDNFPLTKVLQEKLGRVEHVSTIYQGKKMLERGRVDALISFFPSPDNVLGSLKFCQDLFLTKSFNKLHCHRDEKGKAAVKNFNLALERVKKSGELEKLLRKHYGEAGEQMFEFIKKEK